MISSNCLASSYLWMGTVPVQAGTVPAVISTTSS